MVIFEIPTNIPAKLLNQIPGATIKDGSLRFDCSESEARKSIKSALEGHKYVGVIAKAYNPTDSDMAIVKGLFGDANYDISKLVFKQLDTANTLVDRHGDQFTRSALDELARIVNTESRSILIHHDGRRVAGRKYRANVVPATFPNGETGYKLIEYAYVIKDYMMDGNVTLGDKLASGAIRDVSIGFWMTGTRWDDKAGVRTLYHKPGITKTENRETSFVALGAQLYSYVAKSADKFKVKNKKNMETVNIPIGTEVKSFTTESDIQKAFAEVSASAKAATAERDVLQKQVDAMKAPLVNNIINLEKSLKVSDAAKWSEKALQLLDLTRLTGLSNDLDARHKAANPGLNDGANPATPENGKKSAGPNFDNITI